MGRLEDLRHMNARRNAVMDNLYALDGLNDRKSEEAKVRLRKELRELGDKMNELLEKR